MGKLTVTTHVPGNISEVYKKVTFFEGPDSMGQTAAKKKYGRLIQKTDDVYLFQEERETALQWRVRFEPPTRRSMEAVDPKWADRVDSFKQSSKGTEWTITWQTKAKGIVGMLQVLMFQTSGKKKVIRDIVQPVLDEFSKK